MYQDQYTLSLVEAYKSIQTKLYEMLSSLEYDQLPKCTCGQALKKHYSHDKLQQGYMYCTGCAREYKPHEVERIKMYQNVRLQQIAQAKREGKGWL